MSGVNTVVGDVWFGDNSVLSAVADDKGVLLSSGFELVSAVADNGVFGSAFSLAVDAVTTGNVELFSVSSFGDTIGDNCVGFSVTLSGVAIGDNGVGFSVTLSGVAIGAVVLFNSEVLIDELMVGALVADLLKSSVELFKAIRFGLVRASPKSESSLPIRGSTSDVA